MAQKVFFCCLFLRVETIFDSAAELSFFYKKEFHYETQQKEMVGKCL